MLRDCHYCDNKILRRTYPGGQTENTHNFEFRPTCGEKTCKRSHALKLERAKRELNRRKGTSLADAFQQFTGTPQFTTTGK